jgi:hypothetical protein
VDTYERVCNFSRQSNRGDIAFALLLLTTSVRVSHLRAIGLVLRRLPPQAGYLQHAKAVPRIEPPQADCRNYLQEVHWNSIGGRQIKTLLLRRASCLLCSRERLARGRSGDSTQPSKRAGATLSRNTSRATQNAVSNYIRPRCHRWRASYFTRSLWCATELREFD